MVPESPLAATDPFQALPSGCDFATRPYGVYHCLSTFPAQAVYLPGSWDFRIRSTESIVFQLRVVAGAPKSLSIWPR
jgi:hypothetical protein